MFAPIVRNSLLSILTLLIAFALIGCERSKPAEQTPAAAPVPSPSSSFAQPGTAQASVEPVILMLGDSLTAGYGLPAEQAYPALLQRRLEEQDYPHRVVNAGVSGDTSAGGLARLDWLLKQRVDILVLALGANDGLRGQSTDAMRDNLARIIERAQAKGIRVVLAGMQMPINYGPEYTRNFRRVFPELAERYNVPLVPFLLDGVAMNANLNQGDGIHPNAEGARVVADNVWPVLERVLNDQ